MMIQFHLVDNYEMIHEAHERYRRGALVFFKISKNLFSMACENEKSGVTICKQLIRKPVFDQPYCWVCDCSHHRFVETFTHPTPKNLIKRFLDNNMIY